VAERVSISSLRAPDRAPFAVEIKPAGGQPLSLTLKPLAKIQMAQAQAKADDLWTIFMRPPASMSPEQIMDLQTQYEDPTLLPTGQRFKDFDENVLLWGCKLFMAQDGPEESRYLLSEILYLLCHDDYAAELLTVLPMLSGVKAPPLAPPKSEEDSQMQQE